jgi:hypothetical protein
MSSQVVTFNYKSRHSFIEIIVSNPDKTKEWFFDLYRYGEFILTSHRFQNRDNTYHDIEEDFKYKFKEERYYDKDNLIHRFNGPAYVCHSPYGLELRYVEHGNYNCLHGPAYVEYKPDGDVQYKEYYINGNEYYKEIFMNRIMLVKDFINKVKRRLRMKKQKDLVKVGFVNDIAFVVSHYLI